jgi:hypothetical protein
MTETDKPDEQQVKDDAEIDVPPSVPKDADILAKDDPVRKSAQLYQVLDDLARQYQYWHSVQRRRVPKRKIKRQVRELIKRASDLEKYLANLDPDMHYLLYRAWRPLNNRERWKARIQTDARRLTQAGHRALGILAKKRGKLVPDKKERKLNGRPRDYAFQHVIDELLGIYQELTGEPLGVSRNSNGTFGGPLFRFVSYSLSLLQIKKSNAAIGVALQRRIRIKTGSVM